MRAVSCSDLLRLCVWRSFSRARCGDARRGGTAADVPEPAAWSQTRSSSSSTTGSSRMSGMQLLSSTAV